MVSEETCSIANTKKELLNVINRLSDASPKFSTYLESQHSNKRKREDNHHHLKYLSSNA